LHAPCAINFYFIYQTKCALISVLSFNHNSSFSIKNKLQISLIIPKFKAKLKEEREAKRSTLDERHYHLFEIVGNRVGVEKLEVEDAILDGAQVVSK
jgi:hypothetical protein